MLVLNTFGEISGVPRAVADDVADGVHPPLVRPTGPRGRGPVIVRWSSGGSPLQRIGEGAQPSGQGGARRCRRRRPLPTARPLRCSRRRTPWSPPAHRHRSPALRGCPRSAWPSGSCPSPRRRVAWRGHEARAPGSPPTRPGSAAWCRGGVAGRGSSALAWASAASSSCSAPSSSGLIAAANSAHVGYSSGSSSYCSARLVSSSIASSSSASAASPACSMVIVSSAMLLPFVWMGLSVIPTSVRPASARSRTSMPLSTA